MRGHLPPKTLGSKVPITGCYQARRQSLMRAHGLLSCGYQRTELSDYKEGFYSEGDHSDLPETNVGLAVAKLVSWLLL